MEGGRGDTGTEGGGIGQGSVKAFARPDYPRASRLAGHEGTAVFDVEILPDATPGRITLVASSGHRRLDEAALEALKRSSYIPARENGRPVASIRRVAVRFALENDVQVARSRAQGR
jgi:protein TonB